MAKEPITVRVSDYPPSYYKDKSGYWTGVEIEVLDDLTKFGKKFGAQNEVFYPTLSDRLDKDEEFRTHFIFVPDESHNTNKTSLDRIIDFFEDKIYARHAIKNTPRYKGLAVHPFSLTEPIPVYIGVSRKTSDEVRTKLRNAYQSLEREGTIEAILEKWGR